jgi:putative transposase
MSGPQPQRISVTVRQRRVLTGISRRATSPQQQVRRARAVLAAAGGANNAGVARQAGMTRDTARCWRARWSEREEALLAAELEGDDHALEAVIVGVLADEPRSGTPATFTAEQICRLMALACEPPERSGRPTSHWTAREVADEAVRREIVPRISTASVGRFLKRGEDQAPSKPLLADAHPRCGVGGESGGDQHGLPGGARTSGGRGAHREHG